jgi:mannose-6-phosphate isomerase
MHVYPLRFEPRLSERPWGGRRLETEFSRRLPPGVPVGESWEIYGELPVIAGPYAGQTLDELCRRWGPELLGPRAAGTGTFPLLVKWLDCNDWLSVQVHPDDAVARQLTGNPQARGKSECWYVVRADPGAEILHGLKPGVGPEDLEGLSGREIVDLLRRLQPRAGQVVLTPAGTVHAMGPGLFLLEVQQSCDITYRLYDWDRPGLDGRPRPLHLQEALYTLRHAARPPWPEPPPVQDAVGEVLVNCPYFIVERLGHGARWAPRDSFEILVAVQGTAHLSAGSGQERLGPGDSVLVPACAASLGLDLEPGAVLVRVRLP